MTIVDVPTGMSAYSTWLKIEGLVYMGVFFVVYYVKIGLAWHDAGTPFSIPQLSTNLGDAWEQGAEAIVEYLANANVGLATLTGDGDAEAVTFNVLPDPTYV